MRWEFIKERFQEKKRHDAFDQGTEKENTLTTKKKVRNQDLDHAIYQETKFKDPTFFLL